MNLPLKYIFDEIQSKYNQEYDYKNDIKILLNCLTVDERAYVSKEFCTLPWSNHSLNILIILQECDILTATEYILSQEDIQHVQLVLNDFLEFSFDLFVNVLRNCVFNSLHRARLEYLLNDFFRQLLSDLMLDNNVIKINYLQALKTWSSKEIFDMIKSLHLNILFDTDKCEVKEAFVNSKTWKDEIQLNGTTFSRLLNELIKDEDEALHTFCKVILTPNFKGWKFFVILLQNLVTNCDGSLASKIKRSLREQFKAFINRCDERSCIELLITARAIFSESNPNLGSYSQWFKSTFGEMGYLTTAAKFREVMVILTNITDLENEISYLQDQINTTISAPPMCNQIVLQYKKHCRKRLVELGVK